MAGVSLQPSRVHADGWRNPLDPAGCAGFRAGLRPHWSPFRLQRVVPARATGRSKPHGANFIARRRYRKQLAETSAREGGTRAETRDRSRSAPSTGSDTRPRIRLRGLAGRAVDRYRGLAMELRSADHSCTLRHAICTSARRKLAVWNMRKGRLSFVCGRPVGRKGFFFRLRQCGQALSCVRPHSAAVHTPRACMEVRGSGPNRRGALEALRMTLVSPIPSH